MGPFGTTTEPPSKPQCQVQRDEVRVGVPVLSLLFTSWSPKIWCSIDFLIDVMFNSAGCYPFIETILLHVREWFIVWSKMKEYSIMHIMMQELSFLVRRLVSTGCFQNLHLHHNRMIAFFSGTLFFSTSAMWIAVLCVHVQGVMGCI